MRSRFIACVAGLGIILAVAIVADAQQTQSVASAVSRLRAIGQAMQMYAIDNKTYLPADPELLRPYLKDATDAAKKDFVFAIGPKTKINQLKPAAQTPVAMTRPTFSHPLLVLFADGHVEGYLPVPLERLDALSARTTSTQPAAPAMSTTRPAGAMMLPEVAAPTGVPADVAKAIVGAWQTHAGDHIATYQFNDDKSFTLTFVPAPDARYAREGGQATGTWSLDGDRLIMNNQQSTTSFTVAGEREEAQIAGLDEKALSLKTTDKKGREETVVLARSVPFIKGKRDNDKIIGTWNGGGGANGGGLTMVFAESGMAVLGNSKGEWSQAGNKLVVIMTSMPQPPQGNRYAPPQLTEVRFNIELLNDTTLVLTGTNLPPAVREQTVTLLRVK